MPNPSSDSTDISKKNLRLQVFLANAGVASRRGAVSIIEQGHVTVNGKIVTERGYRVNADKDTVQVDDQTIGEEKKVYYIFNKPKKVVSTAIDTHGRPTVVAFFKKLKERILPVGRLDMDTTGLLVMTNDGEMANQLTHPSYGVVKRYAAVLDKPLSKSQMEKFSKGMKLDNVKTATCTITEHAFEGQGYAYEIELHEGKNRQIRRMMEILEREVKDLHRFEYGPLSLGTLKPGQSRKLSPHEVQLLRKSITDGVAAQKNLKLKKAMKQ